MLNKGLISIGALAAAVVLFFAINIVSGRVFTSARADLTEGKLYTLSQGSKNIAAGINEPIKLTLYLTEKAATEVPEYRAYAPRVKELLREFVRSSGGKIKLTIIDPEPFSEAEDKAVQAGIGGLPTGHGDDRLYFGLVGQNATTGIETIPLMSPAREQFLEYDVAQMVYKLSDFTRKPIGLMTWLPIQGSEQNPMTGGRGSPEWQIHKRLKESFDVKPIATSAKEIPSDITVLVIIHPKSVSEATQYAIDQFVLRGGRVVCFVDPICEADVPPGINPMQAMQLPKSSDLPKLFGAWGVEMEAGKIAADKDLAFSVQAGSPTRPEIVPYVAFLKLAEAQRSATDPVTGQLSQFLLGSAGVLTKKDGATTDVEPLLMTTKDAEVVDASLVSFAPDPKKLLADYHSGGKVLWLAVRATGKAKSAFPDGPPKEEPPKPGDKSPAPATPLPHVAESQSPINVVIVADCDMLTDRFWINEQRLGNILLGSTEWTDNGALLTSAVENMSGSNDLIGLRARGKFSRPFTRIKELEANAQQAYQAKEQELKKKLSETEQKINELQKQRADGTDARMVLSPEQQQAIDQFRKQMVDTRKQLREVKFNLDKDTQSLESRLMAINIGAMPAIIALFAIGLAGFRASRRSADRQAASKG